MYPHGHRLESHTFYFTLFLYLTSIQSFIISGTYFLQAFKKILVMPVTNTNVLVIAAKTRFCTKERKGIKFIASCQDCFESLA